MKTETIPSTMPQLGDICPICHTELSAVNFEHFIERSCVCGYRCKDLSGDTKYNYYSAVGSFTVTRSVR